MKKLIALALLVAICGTALVGCGGSPTPTKAAPSPEKKPADGDKGAKPS